MLRTYPNSTFIFAPVDQALTLLLLSDRSAGAPRETLKAKDRIEAPWP